MNIVNIIEHRNNNETIVGDTSRRFSPNTSKFTTYIKHADVKIKKTPVIKSDRVDAI